MPSTRARTSVIATVALASAATLGLASAATAAEVLTYPAEVLPGLTVQTAFPNYVLEVDCDEWVYDEDRDEIVLAWVPGGSLEVRFTCVPDEYFDDSLDEGLDAGDFPAGSTASASSGDFALVVDIDPNTDFTADFGEQFIEIEYYATLAIDNPSGELLFTEELSTPANGTQSIDFADGGPDDVPDDIFICGLSGERVYAFAEFTVLDGGEFSFRIVDVSPRQSGELIPDDGWYTYEPNPWGDYVPISDPYLVLYSDFDVTAPHDGNVDCNDDTNATDFEENALGRDAAGRFISGVFSELIIDLAPGQYTLLLTTYDEVYGVDSSTTPVKAESETAALAPAEYELDGLPEQSATIEFWGAEDGLVLGHTAELAETGPHESLQTGLAVAALFALLLGAVGIAIVRRRSA